MKYCVTYTDPEPHFNYFDSYAEAKDFAENIRFCDRDSIMIWKLVEGEE